MTSPGNDPEHRAEPPVLADQTIDDTDLGWGDHVHWNHHDHWGHRADDQRPDPDDERFLRERPPHWE